LQVTSNVATANILLPVLAEMAKVQNIFRIMKRMPKCRLA
jgi:hypothetical protein